MKVWVCVDEDGELKMYHSKPFRTSEPWWTSDTPALIYYTEPEILQEITDVFFHGVPLTWEDEPVQIDLGDETDVPKNTYLLDGKKYIKVAKAGCFGCVFDIAHKRELGSACRRMFDKTPCAPSENHGISMQFRLYEGE